MLVPTWAVLQFRKYDDRERLSVHQRLLTDDQLRTMTSSAIASACEARMTWRELLKPVLSDGDDYQQQMRLLTTMYGLLIAAGIILGALSAVFTPEPFWRVPTFQGGALFSLVAVLLLALGRSGRPALANLLLGIYGSGLILAFSMIISPNVLYYLTVIVLFASIFISSHRTLNR